MSTRSLRAGIPVALVWVLAAGCSSHPPVRAAFGTISGTVAYREREALPDDAVVDITLDDVSLPDAPPETVAETTVLADGRQVPLPFDLRYDVSDIDPDHDYAVRAVIRSADTVLFATEATPVLTSGHPARVALLAVRAPGAAAVPENPLLGTSWRLEDLGGAADMVESVEATLEFPEPGRAGGAGSCNRFFGTVAIDGDAMTFGELASTKRACPDELMQQERRYLEALRDVQRFALDGATLRLFTRDADAPLRFVRAGS